MDLGWIDTDPGGEGGRSTLTLKVKLGLTCGSGVDWHWSLGGSIDTHFQSEVGITLQIWGGSTLILGGSIDTHFESEVGINLRIRGGSTLILGAGICLPWLSMCSTGWPLVYFKKPMYMLHQLRVILSQIWRVAATRQTILSIKELHIGGPTFDISPFLVILGHFEPFLAIFAFFSFHVNPLRSLWCCNDTIHPLGPFWALAPLIIGLAPWNQVHLKENWILRNVCDFWWPWPSDPLRGSLSHLNMSPPENWI